MYFPSRLHSQVAMGRLVSVVRRWAELNGSSVLFTHRLRVSFQGLTNARYLPSGEICAPVISGFPNNRSRSIKAGAGELCAVRIDAKAVPSRVYLHRLLTGQRAFFESGGMSILTR